MTLRARIIDLCDAGWRPSDIAAEIDCSVEAVYAVLRKHRPDRPRARREGWSDRPRAIACLHAAGFRQARIARLLSVSRQYVSATLSGQK